MGLAPPYNWDGFDNSQLKQKPVKEIIERDDGQWQNVFLDAQEDAQELPQFV